MKKTDLSVKGDSQEGGPMSPRAILMDAPLIVSAARRRGWIRPARPGPSEAEATAAAVILGAEPSRKDERFPVLTVTVRSYGDSYIARTSMGHLASCTMDAESAVIRAAMKGVAISAKAQGIAAPEKERLAIHNVCGPVWLAMVLTEAVLVADEEEPG